MAGAPPSRKLSLAVGAAGAALAVAGIGMAVHHSGGGASAARPAPPIHDVATDWRDPVMFSPKLLALRGPRADPVEIAPAIPEGPQAGGLLGRPVAEVSAASCPGAEPLLLSIDPAAAFARAELALAAEGLKLVDADTGAGVLEATARHGLFGPAEDMAVRVRAEGAGARIDLRSVSRRGLSDGGSNCARVLRLRAAMARGGRPS